MFKQIFVIISFTTTAMDNSHIKIILLLEYSGLSNGVFFGLDNTSEVQTNYLQCLLIEAMDASAMPREASRQPVPFQDTSPKSYLEKMFHSIINIIIIL